MAEAIQGNEGMENKKTGKTINTSIGNIDYQKIESMGFRFILVLLIGICIGVSFMGGWYDYKISNIVSIERFKYNDIIYNVKKDPLLSTNILIGGNIAIPEVTTKKENKKKK